jgi:hypothetical protein
VEEIVVADIVRTRIKGPSHGLKDPTVKRTVAHDRGNQHLLSGGGVDLPLKMMRGTPARRAAKPAAKTKPSCQM